MIGSTFIALDITGQVLAHGPHERIRFGPRHLVRAPSRLTAEGEEFSILSSHLQTSFPALKLRVITDTPATVPYPITCTIVIHGMGYSPWLLMSNAEDYGTDTFIHGRYHTSSSLIHI